MHKHLFLGYERLILTTGLFKANSSRMIFDGRYLLLLQSTMTTGMSGCGVYHMHDDQLHLIATGVGSYASLRHNFGVTLFSLPFAWAYHMFVLPSFGGTPPGPIVAYVQRLQSLHDRKLRKTLTGMEGTSMKLTGLWTRESGVVDSELLVCPSRLVTTSLKKKSQPDHPKRSSCWKMTERRHLHHQTTEDSGLQTL